MCRACRYEASLTAGTIFHKTRTPLFKWFWLIYRMATSKTGVSIAEMQREQGVPDYRTMWVLAPKMRKAMADRDSQYQLAGLVKVDDAFIGPRKPGPPGGRAKGKAKVVIAVESLDKHAGIAVMMHVPAVDGDQILTIAQDKIQPASDVRTDGWRAHQKLESNEFGHEAVIVSKDKEALKQLGWVHVLIANVKGNLRGVYHGVSAKHLGSLSGRVLIPVQSTFLGFTAVRPYCYRMPFNLHSNI